MLHGSPLPSAAPGLPAQRFDLNAEARESDGSARGMAVLFALAGAVQIGLGLFAWFFEASAFAQRPGAAAILAGTLVAVGSLLLAMGLYVRARPARVVRVAIVDDLGIRLEMTRPPSWTLRWGEPGGFLNLSRGFRVGAPDETEPKGWVVNSRRFSTTVNGAVGRAIVEAARAKNYRVVDETMAGAPGDLVFEVVTIDHPDNPARVRRPMFRNRAQPFG